MHNHKSIEITWSPFLQLLNQSINLSISFKSNIVPSDYMQSNLNGCLNIGKPSIFNQNWLLFRIFLIVFIEISEKQIYTTKFYTVKFLFIANSCQLGNQTKNILNLNESMKL